MKMKLQGLTAVDVDGAAEIVGVSSRTIRSYNGHAMMLRRAGKETFYTFPAPDGYIGRTPVWYVSTLRDWLKIRPGKGFGGGRAKEAIAAK